MDYIYTFHRIYENANKKCELHTDILYDIQRIQKNVNYIYPYHKIYSVNANKKIHIDILYDIQQKCNKKYELHIHIP